MDLKGLILFYGIIIVTTFILFIGIALNINNLNYAGVIYGVRVPNKYRKDIKIENIDKEYKKKSVIYILILTIIFSFLIFKFQKVFISILYIFIMYICTFVDYKKRKNIKLNGGTYEQIKEIENTSFKSTNSMMSGISIFIAVLMLCITFIITGIIKSTKLGFNITMIITVIMTIYILIYTIYLMSQNKNINKDYNSKSPEYYIDDDDEFKWGIFYYNPKDKSILSRKRMGIGYDFNCGNEKAIIIVILLSFILISSLVMTIILGV